MRRPVNYGLLEQQFRTYYDKALSAPSSPARMLWRMLETRFDNASTASASPLALRERCSQCATSLPC